MNPETTTSTPPTIPEQLNRSAQVEQSANADYLELGVSDAEAVLKTYKKENPGIAENLIQAQARGEYTPVIAKKIRRKKSEAQEVREAMEVEQVVQDLNHNAQNILRAVSEFLHAADLGIIAKPQDAQTRAVFESMVDKTEGRLTKKTAAFLVPLIDGMLSENNYVRFAAAGQPATQFETDMMGMLSGNDDETAFLLNEILLGPVAQGKLQNMDAPRFKTFFTELRTKKRAATETKKKEIIDAAKKAQTKNNSSFASQEYERIFSEDDPEKKRAFELYEAIKSSNVDDFVAYYERATSRMIESKNCSREEAGKLVTGDIHDTLLYIVNTIYATTLAKAPKAEFKQVANEQGAGSYVNPNNIFNEVVAGNLSRLLESAQKRIDQQEQPWYVHGRRKTENYNPDRQKIEETTVPIAKLEKTNLTKYVQSLREIVEIEQGALEYQFNLRYIIEHPPAADKGGVFGSIAGYAKQSLKTETIDHLYILPHNEVIQAAVMSLEPMYKRLFAKYDWRKDQALQAELFEQMRPAEKKAIEQLQTYFKGTIPAWTVERAFNHARLLSFGKEFAFQALASYADPLLTDEGDPTYLGEGPLDANSVYDLFVAAKRWGSADPIIVGLPYMPENAMIDEFHPKELKEEGEKRWKDSFTNGTLAYYESKVFKDSHPMISITNMTKMGGVDTYGGWRVKYAYSHWLNEIIDKKSNSMDMKRPDNNLLVNGWKSIENIGTNVLKNYAESFIFDGDIEKHEAKFEQFFKFLHRRYFKEGMGKSLYQDVASETAFWDKVKDEVSRKGKGSSAAKQEIVKRYVYDALTVALFERMPLEFVFMERRRASQNGVTMQQELLEEFVGSPGKDKRGKWAQDAETKSDFSNVINTKWEVALDDLIYVQQVARMESIRKMKDMENSVEDPNKLGVLYGDLTQDKSDVGYAITPEFLVRVLNEKYKGEPDMENKVKRAKDMYESIFRRIQAKPEEGKLEKRWKTDDNKKYREVRNNHITTRSRWFADTWRKDDFGMQFTTAEAGQFMNRSATGEDLVARTAEASLYVAEATKNFVAGGGLLEGISDAVRKGKEGWESLTKGVGEVYKSAKIEDQGIAKKIVRQLVNWQVSALRKDSRNLGSMGALNARIAGVKTSLAASKVDMGGVAYDFDPHDVAAYVQEYTSKNIISGHTKAKDQQFMEVPQTLVEKIVSKVTGREATNKLVRDYASEGSGEAIMRLHKSAQPELIKRNLYSVMGLMAVAILYIYLQKAMEEEGK